MTKKTDSPYASVQDKIHLEKQLPFNPHDKTGPTTDLYFHELTAKKHPSQNILSAGVSMLLGIIFVLTLPLIALLITCTSRGPIFRKINTTGRRGMTFQQYVYSTKRPDTSKSTFIGGFLEKTGLYRLPTLINIWKGEINLIGPLPYATKWCNKWNNHLSDYYKRFALRPGFFGVAGHISDPGDIDEVASTFEKELEYILNPSLKKDLKILFGIY